MAVHYKRLPTADVDLKLNMNFRSSFLYENNEDTAKKYRSIYHYSDYTKEIDIVRGQEAAPPGRFCQMWSLFVTMLCYIILFLTLPLSGWFCFKTVHHYERLVIFRLGHLIAAKGPGVVLVLPCIDRISKVDLRTKAFSIPPQKILTSDNAAIEIGADVYYRIYDAVLSVSRVQDLDVSTRVLSQTVLQNHLTKQTLTEIDTNKLALAQLLLDKINQMTKTWGMEVGRVEISAIKVIQGPMESGCQAQNFLNMITPALFPPGSNAPLAQETSCTPANLLKLQAQQMEKAGLCSKGTTSNISQGPAVLDIDGPVTSSRSSEPKTKLILNLDTPHDIIQAVRPHLSPSLVKEFGILYKFIVRGKGGGTFYLDLKNGGGNIDQGDPPNSSPDVTLTLSIDILRRILQGESSAFSAYMTGELVVDGDVQAATRLAKLVDYIN